MEGKKTQRSNTPGKIWEYVKAIGTALILALIIRTFAVQAFKIPSGSMIPTLLVGDHLLVNKMVYGTPVDIPFTNVTLFHMPGLRHPQRGILFRHHLEAAERRVNAFSAILFKASDARLGKLCKLRLVSLCW